MEKDWIQCIRIRDRTRRQWREEAQDQVCSDRHSLNSKIEHSLAAEMMNFPIQEKKVKFLSIKINGINSNQLQNGK